MSTMKHSVEDAVEVTTLMNFGSPAIYVRGGSMVNVLRLPPQRLRA